MSKKYDEEDEDDDDNDVTSATKVIMITFRYCIILLDFNNVIVVR